MFVQVIEGDVTNASEVRSAFDRWVANLGPDAAGWLGTTAGVTDDGHFIALARFESEEAARRNSQRPEQDKWWSEMAGFFKAPATFRESSDVIPDLAGDPDSAGFVQIMRGRGTNNERARELMTQDSDLWAEFRPDVLGSLALIHDDGTYTMALYFTSEAEAREGEKKEPPEALKAQMAEMDSLTEGTPEFFDLKDPWLYSKR